MDKLALLYLAMILQWTSANPGPGYTKRPLLEYGDAVWNSPLTQIDALENAQKRACKIMLGKNYMDAVVECEIETLSDRRQIRCLKFAQTLSNNKQTENLIPPNRKTHMVDNSATQTPSHCFLIEQINSERAQFPL